MCEHGGVGAEEGGERERENLKQDPFSSRAGCGA